MESATKEGKPESGDMTEIWKPVRGYEEYYEVSNLGRVRSLDRWISVCPKGKNSYQVLHCGRILRPLTLRNGYLRVCLQVEKNRSDFLVHRLVAEAFLERKPEMNQVNHIDYQRQNNRVDNLEWTTPHLNNLHSSENMCVDHHRTVAASGSKYIYGRRHAWQLYIKLKHHRHCRTFPTLEAAIQAKEAYFNAQHARLG